jgi:hypothetical protein
MSHHYLGESKKSMIWLHLAVFSPVAAWAGCTATNDDPSTPADNGTDETDNSDESVEDTATSGSDAETSGTSSNSDDETNGSTDASDDPADSSDASDDSTLSDDSSNDESSETSSESGEPRLLFTKIDPAETVLELDLGESAAQKFIVTGHYSDGSTLDLSADVDWSHSNANVGTLTGQNLEIAGFSARFIGNTVITTEIDGIRSQAQMTVAAYRRSGPQTDFFFVLPFEDPNGVSEKPLTFGTGVKSMDVFVSMDTTGSMTGPIVNLQKTLSDTVIPEIKKTVPDTQFGIGGFDDFPVSPFGDPNCGGKTDQPFTLVQEITDVVADAQSAVATLTPVGCGADLAESNIEALYQIATGEGLTGPASTSVPSNASGIGGVGFRDGSMPVVVTITDALSQDPGGKLCTGEASYGANASVKAVAHTRAQALDALNAICARVVTVAVGTDDDTCSAYSDGLDFAAKTGTSIPPEAWNLAAGGRPTGCAADQCCTGLDGAGEPKAADGMCPLVYRADPDGTGVGAGMTDAVSLVASYSPFDVTSALQGEVTDVDGSIMLPAGKTTADFVAAVQPISHGTVPLPGVTPPVITATGFEHVIPNTDLTFNVKAYNDFMPAAIRPQLFEATIHILADGCTGLDERTVLILVPPAPPPG